MTKFYKHKMYKDVCWRILAEYPIHPKYTKYKIEWWNLGCLNSYNMGIKQYTEIEAKDKKDWLYTTDMIPCLRNANWKPL